MDKQISEFHKLNKQDWLKLIESALKSGDLKDLNWIVEKDLKGLPYAHASDLEAMPEPFYKNGGTNEWMSGCYSSFADIPDSLEGYQALALTDKINPNQMRSILSSHPEIMEFRINGDNTEYLEQFLNEMPAFFIQDKKQRKLCVEISDFNNIDENFVQQSLKTYDFVQFIVCDEKILDEGALVEHYSAFFTEFSNWLVKSKILDFSPNLFKRLKLGHRINTSSFLYETALIRALKLLWYNLQKKILNEVERIKIDCAIDLSALSLDPNHQLILGTSAAASAVIAGVDTLYLMPDLRSDDIKVSQRLSRNIQLILKREVGLENVMDPLAGSYAVEHLTQLLAEAIWNAMEEKLA